MANAKNKNNLSIDKLKEKIEDKHLWNTLLSNKSNKKMNLETSNFSKNVFFIVFSKYTKLTSIFNIG